MTAVDRTGFLRFFRTLEAGRRCRVLVVEVATGRTTVVHEDRDLLLEAPNWTRDDRLVLNGGGALWSLAPAPGAELVRIPLEGVPALNNDHVPAPDGTTIYVSANDWHVYAAPLEGGRARRITAEADRMHFLHGVSPDGTRLAYTAIEPGPGEFWERPGTIRSVGADGSDDVLVFGSPRPSDGSEYSPDGEWILFSTEAFTTAPGHAQIARIRPDGTGLERLTTGEGVDWFPHLAPVGGDAVFLRYPPGTVGHPADLDVELLLVRGGDWAHPEVVVSTSGGQGTINVNSWSPDGTRFACVDYPQDD